MCSLLFVKLSSDLIKYFDPKVAIFLLSETHTMNHLFIIALIAVFVGVSLTAAAVENETIFPPVQCPTSGLNVLTWDGQHNVTCLPFPVCTGAGQFLSYDGTTGAVTCQPQGMNGVPAAVPTSAGG
jgi:hypothetical protein